MFNCRYQSSAKFEKMGYEDDFLRFLQNLISDVEKRIRRGHQRLALNNTQGNVRNIFENISGVKLLLYQNNLSVMCFMVYLMFLGLTVKES